MLPRNRIGKHMGSKRPTPRDPAASPPWGRRIEANSLPVMRTTMSATRGQCERSAAVGCPFEQDPVALAPASPSASTVVEYQRLGVGVRQAFGLAPATQPQQHFQTPFALTVDSCIV